LREPNEGKRVPLKLTQLIQMLSSMCSTWWVFALSQTFASSTSFFDKPDAEKTINTNARIDCLFLLALLECFRTPRDKYDYKHLKAIKSSKKYSLFLLFLQKSRRIMSIKRQTTIHCPFLAPRRSKQILFQPMRYERPAMSDEIKII
jgi:hypothetical protein